VAFQRRKSAEIGVKAPLPGFSEPALASVIERVPSGSRWIPEIKFDGSGPSPSGQRGGADIHPARSRLDASFQEGRPRRPAHQGRLRRHRRRDRGAGRRRYYGLRGAAERDQGQVSIVLVAFDLLYLNGRDLRKAPLFQRKAELKKIIAGTEVQFSESFEVDGQEMFAHACEVGLEGVVSKVRDSVYPTGRSNDWVKKTCAQRETLTIAGFALDGSKWDGLFVGRRKGGDLVYAGKVDQGLDKVWAADLRKRLEPLVRKTQAFKKRVAHKGIWVEPKLLAEIEYRAKSA
jgi:bifunctional non-homologous end joining protein LigD